MFAVAEDTVASLQWRLQEWMRTIFTFSEGSVVVFVVVVVVVVVLLLLLLLRLLLFFFQP